MTRAGVKRFFSVVYHWTLPVGGPQGSGLTFSPIHVQYQGLVWRSVLFTSSAIRCSCGSFLTGLGAFL